MTAMTAFHAGEASIHAELGIAERMAVQVSPVIRDHLPEQHREFFTLLPWLLLGSVDADGQPTASVLSGRPGFVHSPDPASLRIDALPTMDDPLRQSLQPGAQIGVLGLQPHTRRRNRANGIVTDIDAGGFNLAVRQSFGNCPKYIQAREPQRLSATAEPPPAAQQFDHLPALAMPLINSADTLFIASAHPRAVDGAASARAHGVDVSHRGGSPGFLHRDVDGSLLLPDYPGNRFFNTIGNLRLNAQAGLLLIDYAHGDLLQLSAQAAIETHPALLARFPGAERLLRFTVTRTLWRPGALPLHWSAGTPSPVLAMLGA